MRNTGETESFYGEVQRPNQWWVWTLTVVITILAWWIFVDQIILGNPFGNRPAPDWVVWLVGILFGVLLPLLMISINLKTLVARDRIILRYFPLHTRTVMLADIDSCITRTYRPIREYGGWGIRFGFGHGMAYNVHGNRGVQLELKGAKRLLIGSQRADQLTDVINKARAAVMKGQQAS
jgi:hypothetical protein